MTDLSKFLTKVTPQRDPGQERAYALGAFETVQYMYDIMTRAGDDADLKRLIRDEYMRTRERLHDAVMPVSLIRVDAEKGGNGPVSEEGERDE
jgi:hypothetical protein